MKARSPMSLSSADVSAIKLTLGAFDPYVPLDLANLDRNSALYLYFDQFSFAKISAAAYHLGYVNFPGSLGVWGNITCHWWRVNTDATTQACGTICFAPGLFDHAGLFQPLFTFFLAQGYDVVCLEMPGHGLSDGRDCAIDSFVTYANIWHGFLQGHQQYFAHPLVGVGQSTGCTALTVLTLAGDFERYFSQLIFFAPLVRPRKWWRLKLMFLLLGKILTKIPRSLRENSHCAEFNRLLFGDILQPRFLSVRWAAALYEWVSYLPRLDQSSTPLLILQGTGDKVVDWRFNVLALQRHFSNSKVNYLDDAQHHLANESEPWRAEMFALINDFIRVY